MGKLSWICVQCSQATPKQILRVININLKCSQKLFIYWVENRVIKVENYKLEKLVAKADFPTILTKNSG